MVTIFTNKLPAWTNDWTIASVKANPKRATSEAYAAYEAMEEGMTIAEYAVALAKVRYSADRKPKKVAAELKWNFERNFITLLDTEGNLHAMEVAEEAAEAVEA
jgi:hypothetical protein